MTVPADIRLVAEGLPDLCPQLHRSPGMHVSDVIRDICLRLGHFKESDPEESEATRYTRFGLGSALEHAIIEQYERDDPGRFVRGFELECDGLFGTPDLLDPVACAVHEIKLTKSSARHDPRTSTKFERYWWQIGAYCHALNWNRSVLHVGYVNGDYKEVRELYRVWEAHWTDKELDTNWLMLTTHARTMQRTND